jgi:hypothetical protein
LTSSAKALFSKLEGYRTLTLDVAREAAKLTIPSLMREEGASMGTNLDLPLQTTGSEGLNNLASKLTLGLFPPGQSFFRFAVTPSDELELGVTEKGISEVQQSLSLIEREITAEFESGNYRDKLHESLLHLALTGNGLLYLPVDGDLEFYRLDQFVVERDPAGNLLTVVTCEKVDRDALSDEVRELVPENGPQDPMAPAGSGSKAHELYTIYQLKDGKFEGWQEIDGTKIPGTEGDYIPEEFPYLALRWSPVAKEYYGRGHIELHMGALKALDSITTSIVKGAAAAARVNWMVRPNAAGYKANQLQGMENGEFGVGNEDDYWCMKLDKGGDFAVAASVREDLKRDLSRAFLLNSSVQRNAERVTATEIRILAQELESALGGVFAIMRAEFQLPIVKWIMRRLQKAGKIQALPEGIEPIILTGLEALGRGQEAEKIRLAAGLAQELFPNGEAVQYLDAAAVVRRMFESVGVPNAEELLKSEEELQQEAQEAQARTLVTEGAPALAQAAQAAQTFTQGQ